MSANDNGDNNDKDTGAAEVNDNQGSEEQGSNDQGNNDKGSNDQGRNDQGRNDQGRNDQGNQHSSENLDLASMMTSLPRRNFSAHPNIKLLPGLDFDVPQDAPFASQQHSGLVAKMFLPRAVNQPASLEGLINAADRVRQLMEVGLRTYQSNPKLASIREVFVQALRQLRGLHPNWNFDAAPRKSSAIIDQVITARKLFLTKGGDKPQIRSTFLPFLQAIDEFIDGAESKIAAQQAANAPLVLPAQAGRKRTSDDLEDKIYNLPKMRRITPSENEDEAEGSAKTADEEVVCSKCKGLEAGLKAANERVELVALRVHDGWVHRMRQLWDVVRPAVNRERKDQGKAELESDQLVRFLRTSKLGDIADDILGLKS
ncbi:hypothetical protein K4K49_012482 [Colletotrichum sp. SAR 10_70]|nr:hypothetical protein K4K50_011946 [Colletotrichum sp. SAR 10_71]KAI8189612.1 hypothetical protein K4K49_012482 [Colletotrichum sp. SAR 10_70]